MGDKLEIFDGNTNSSKSLASIRLNQNILPQPILSTENNIFLQFKCQSACIINDNRLKMKFSIIRSCNYD